jgi:hypothetical protein
LDLNQDGGMKWRSIKTLQKHHIQDRPRTILLGNSCNGPGMYRWLQLHEQYRYPPDIAQAIKDEGVWTHWYILPDISD